MSTKNFINFKKDSKEVKPVAEAKVANNSNKINFSDYNYMRNMRKLEKSFEEGTSVSFIFLEERVNLHKGKYGKEYNKKCILNLNLPREFYFKTGKGGIQVPCGTKELYKKLEELALDKRAAYFIVN